MPMVISKENALQSCCFPFLFFKEKDIPKDYISKLCLEISVLVYTDILTTFIIYFSVYSHVDLWLIAPKLVL